MTDIKVGNRIVNSSEIVEGGLYYLPNKAGKFSVSKVLVIDDFTFHVRIYANKFDKPPLEVNSSELNLGSVDGSDGFGIGHAPIDKEGFLNELTFFIRQESVSEEELEGYKYYLDAMQ
ncbi:MAG: hypothetical protein KI793_11270 [Rivularia sp. (in: Bacteria)]|nr:hypothetical protein [Rivularia sp. MS3]